MARATDRNFSYLLGLSVFSHDNRGNFGGLTAAALGCNHLIKRAGEGGGGVQPSASELSRNFSFHVVQSVIKPKEWAGVSGRYFVTFFS